MELSIFETTARRAENLASSHFNLYKTKLILFALAGYLVIFSLLTLAIGSLVGIGYLAIFYTGWIILLVKKKVIFLIIPMIWMLLKACWVRI